MHRELLPLVTGSVTGGDRVDAGYRDWCAEADSPRVGAALASTRCDWEIAYDFHTNPSPDWWFQGMVFGECLALNGSRHLQRHDWTGSAKAFLTTLSVASDLSQGSLEMNVAAVSVAQWAVRGFAEAISRIEDGAQIGPLAQQFVQLEAVMPSFRIGLAQQQLARAVQATSMARAYAYDRRYGFWAIVPWRAIAAWRLSQQERIISKVSLLTSTSDPAKRSQVIGELSRPGPLSAPVVPGSINDALNQQDRLARTVHATHTAIQLQEWYARHREYPRTAPGNSTQDLEYEPIDGGKGYRLRTRPPTGVLEPFLERMPAVP